MSALALVPLLTADTRDWVDKVVPPGIAINIAWHHERMRADRAKRPGMTNPGPGADKVLHALRKEHTPFTSSPIRAFRVPTLSWQGHPLPNPSSRANLPAQQEEAAA